MINLAISIFKFFLNGKRAAGKAAQELCFHAHDL